MTTFMKKIVKGIEKVIRFRKPTKIYEYLILNVSLYDDEDDNVFTVTFFNLLAVSVTIPRFYKIPPALVDDIGFSSWNFCLTLNDISVSLPIRARPGSYNNRRYCYNFPWKLDFYKWEPYIFIRYGKQVSELSPFVPNEPKPNDPDTIYLVVTDSLNVNTLAKMTLKRHVSKPKNKLLGKFYSVRNSMCANIDFAHPINNQDGNGTWSISKGEYIRNLKPSSLLAKTMLVSGVVDYTILTTDSSNISDEELFRLVINNQKTKDLTIHMFKSVTYPVKN